MRRIRLTLEYVGTLYCGWQVQDNGLSVQQVVTEAIEGMVGHKATLVGCSRTDAGVHALGLVAHFDTPTDIATFGFLRGLNTVLPSDIRVIDVADAHPKFHAQKDAKGKWYRYVVFHGPHDSALLAHRVWHRFRPFNLNLMMEVSQHLVGTHDFSSYCAIDDQNKSKVRTLQSISWTEAQTGDWMPFVGAMPLSGRLIFCDIRGEGFLKQMVRNIVGTIVEVGEGRRPPDEVQRALETQHRSASGVCAPPDGLYLVKVDY